MKKPERMKNKTTKAFLYQNLYPVNLYVTTLDDWEDACDFFDFFLTTKELRNDEPERDRPKLSSVMGATFLVREKYSRAVGILIVLDDFHCSTFGKVRSKDRIIEHSNGRLHKTIGKILVQRLDHNGYLTVPLQKNKRNYKVKVHRLVLSTFSECIGEQVNHIDEDKTNNKLLNLEWCTAKYNANYGTRNARIQKRNEHRRKLDKILLNQQVILLYLRQILQDTNRSQFLEDYAANLAAQATEIILGHNIVRK